MGAGVGSPEPSQPWPHPATGAASGRCSAHTCEQRVLACGNSSAFTFARKGGNLLSEHPTRPPAAPRGGVGWGSRLQPTLENVSRLARLPAHAAAPQHRHIRNVANGSTLLAASFIGAAQACSPTPRGHSAHTCRHLCMCTEPVMPAHGPTVREEQGRGWQTDDRRGLQVALGSASLRVAA